MEQRRTVLLADTSTEFRILLREAMEKTGEFWVDVAQTGDEVLEKVQEQEPDILIMDVILPVWWFGDAETCAPTEDAG